MSKNFNISFRRLVGSGFLNKTKIAILKELKHRQKPLTIKNLIEALDLKRLSLLYNLKALETLGLVQRDRSLKVHWWRLREENFSLTESAQEEIPIYAAYQLLAESSSQKIYGIQGAGAVKNIAQLIEQEGNIFTKVHLRQKLRQEIIDGIVTERGGEIIKKLPKTVLKSHFGRPTILHIVPDNDFIHDLEILSDGKLVLVISHKDGKAFMIKSFLAENAFRALFESIKDSGIKKSPTEVYGELND